MEFKINSKVLEKLLSRVIPAVPSRTPMPVLENFLLEIKDGLLVVSATDLDISLRASTNVAAEKDIKMVVPARLLYDVVRNLDETQIHFENTPNMKLKMKTDFGTYNIGYSSHEDFPAIPSVNREKEIVLNGVDLKRAIDQTAFAMSREDMRPAMTGTLFELSPEGLRFVTTDSHRLVKYVYKNIKSEKNEQYIIPERAISVLAKLLSESDVKIYLSKTHLSFNIGDIEFVTRLIGEKYPSYNSVIPLENENILKVKTSELLSSIKRMLLFSSSNIKQVKFSIDKNNLEVSSEDIDKGSSAVENIVCDYNGEPMDIGFNTSYMNDILLHITSDDVIFKLHSPTKACIVEPSKIKENEELLLLLMPVRLNN